MPFSKVTSGGAQDRNIEVELITVAPKLVGGPDGAVIKKIMQFDEHCESHFTDMNF